MNVLKSLKGKIVIPIVGILIVVIAVIVVFVAITTAELVRGFDDERMAAATQSVRAYLRAHEQQTLIAATSLGGSAELIGFINANDRDAVWQYLVSRKSVMEVDEIIVAGADGITIARSHQRDNYGDDVSGVPSIAAGLRGDVLQLYTPTPTAEMVMTTASPVMDGDTLVGSVVVNYVVGSNDFLDRIRSSFEVDATVFRGDTSVASTLIHPDTGMRAIGTPVAPHIAEAVLGRGEPLALDLNVFGMLPYSAYYFPLMGADGRTPVGIFFVGISQERANAITGVQQLSIIIIGVVGLLIMVFVVVYIATSISKPLSVYEQWMRRTTVDGNTDLTAEERSRLGRYISRSDELGTLFGSYASLVETFDKIKKELEEIADGNLAVDIHIRSDKDSIALTLERMLGSLNGMFGEINDASTQVANGSKQIASGSQALAQGSTEQAATVQQLSASISEIARKTKENAGMAGNAASLAGSIKQSAEKGSTQMDEMMAAVKEINQASQSISKVIKVIDDIAFQTNILALNAAVEAARAGQHGKGFAVVAEEVRNLAAKSAEAAKDTGGLIASSMEKAELGAKIAESTAASLEEIVAGINESTQLVSDIAISSEEQSRGITEVNSGIDQVAQVVQQNSATAQQSAAASEEMNGQSELLKELVSQFKLKDKNFGKMPSATMHKLSPPSAQTPQARDNLGSNFGKY